MNPKVFRRMNYFLVILIVPFSLIVCGREPSGQEKMLEEAGVVRPSRGSPEAGAEAGFEIWAQRRGIPYRNVRYSIVSNDGTFATVHIIAEFRESAETNWLEQYADTECRKVGNEWQCDLYFNFQPTTSQTTPIPGSEIGLTYDDPAYLGDKVINNENVQLRILAVNRNASVPGIVLVEGRELVVITIELVNLGSEEFSYDESDFTLINQFKELYTISPAAASVDGALGRGILAPDEGIESRLVFEIIAGESDLVLAWHDRESDDRYIYLQ